MQHLRHGRVIRGMRGLGDVVTTQQGFQITTDSEGAGIGAMPPPPPKPSTPNWLMWAAVAAGAYFVLPSLLKK